MNQLLGYFYTAYLAWLESGAEEKDNGVFRRENGLCTNLARYRNKECAGNAAYFSARDEMYSQFTRHGLDRYHPFTPVVGQYLTESIQKIAHLNPDRVQWVKEQVTKFKEQ